MNIVEFFLFLAVAILVVGGAYLIGFNYGAHWALKKYAEIETRGKA